MPVQQVHFARWELGGEQYDSTGPAGVFVEDVPDDQAFLVGFGHHLCNDISDVSYLHGSHFFLDSNS
jgi:hypothetical protein